ncbi:MAG: glycosyltransferase family 2 protein [Chlamydiia bacterium]|nr:glycosyltransferase family 2 protein [Chlamydiia bacterium]
MLTVTILAKNAAQTLAGTLDSCRLFPEVLLFDTGSTDATLEIARAYPNVRIVKHPFIGFGPCHNAAAKEARYDWILSLDSDEVLSEALVQEILSLSLHPKQVYAIHRCNYFHNQRIRCCSGWYPDWNIRLFCRTTTSFTDDLVHETVRSQALSIVRLQGKMYHTPYLSIEHLLQKISSLSKAIGHGIGAFLKNYFLKRGFLGGKEGFIISLYNAQCSYYKYLKLAWRNNSL